MILLGRPLRRPCIGVLLIGVGLLTAGCGKPCKDIGLYLVRPDGSSEHRVRPDIQTENLFDATWLPGGQRIAFTTFASWWVMNADGSDVQPLPWSRPMFAASGTRLAWIRGWIREEVRGGYFVKVRFTIERPPKPRASMRGKVLNSKGVGGFSVLRAGEPKRQVFYQGFPLFPVFGVPGTDESPRLSPDGRFVAYTDSKRGQDDIYTISTHAGSRQRLTRTSDWDDVAPMWSPDGRRIAFTRRSRDLSSESVYVMNADGTGQRLISQQADQVAWAPDGHALVVSRSTGGADEGELAIVDLRGTVIRRLTSADIVPGLTWAPADRIAYIKNTGDDTQERCDG